MNSEAILIYCLFAYLINLNVILHLGYLDIFLGKTTIELIFKSSGTSFNDLIPFLILEWGLSTKEYAIWGDLLSMKSNSPSGALFIFFLSINFLISLNLELQVIFNK